MHRYILIAKNAVLGGGVVQLILGMMFWADIAKALVPVHLVVGTFVAVSLLSLGILALRTEAPVWLGILGTVWALGLPVFGGLQRSLLVGSSHWIIQVIHLLLGICAMGLASIIASKAAPNRSKVGSDEHDLAGR